MQLNAELCAGSFGGLQRRAVRRCGRTPEHTKPGCLRQDFLRSVCTTVSPVMFPPGRERLATCPSPTGSAWAANTIGMVLVACRAAFVSVDDTVKITSTFMR